MTHASTDRAPRIALRHLPMAILAMAALLTAGSRLSAQGWEWTYGSATGQENGELRVIPVTQGCSTMTCCAGTDGYIAVGTHEDDVYVVRTDNNGASIWEYTYDITDNGDEDEAYSIIELADGSGFAITGVTIYNNGSTPTDGFILKIDCNGAVVWAYNYGRTTTAETGRDIIEAQTGSLIFGTSPGDLVVAGYSNYGANGSVNGWIFRVNAAGTLIWSQTYHRGGVEDVSNDLFFALTEATPIGLSVTGDIIAVGMAQIDPSPTLRGFAARVNGNSGAIGAAPQNMAVYANNSVLYSVEELQNPNEQTAGGVPHVVMAGYVPGSMYFLKLTGGDPCSVALQTSVGDPLPLGNWQIATTIRELRFSTTGYSGNAAQWDLVVSGYGVLTSGGSEQALLLTLNPGTLLPAGITTQFGGSGQDRALSVYPVDATGGRAFGFILCGLTTTDWQNDGDPMDMYLIKTDGFGASGCSDEWFPTDGTPTGANCVSALTASGMFRLTVDPPATERDWGYQVCSPAPKRMPDVSLSERAPSLSLLSVSGGTVFIPTRESSVTSPLGVYDLRGKRVDDVTIAETSASTSIAYHPIGLPAGIYFIRRDGPDGGIIARLLVLQ